LGDRGCVAEPPREAGGPGALRGLLDPERVAIDARHPRLSRQHGAEEPAPVPDPAADVEHLPRGAEAPARRHELYKILVPPEVARIAEVLRRMGAVLAELVAHAPMLAHAARPDDSVEGEGSSVERGGAPRVPEGAGGGRPGSGRAVVRGQRDAPPA